MSEGELFQLRLVFANRYFGDTHWNAAVTLHFQDKGGGDVLNDLGADFIGNLGTVWFDQLSLDTFLDRVEVRALDREGQPEVMTSPDPELHGGVDAQVVPHQVAALIRWKTAIVGRPYEGRSYLYGFTCPGIFFGNFWDSPVITAMQDIGDQMLFTYGAEGASDLATFVIVSTKLHKEMRPEPIITPVTAYEAVSLLATQRRRLYLLPE